MAIKMNRSFWKDGLSLDESRVSILMIFLIIFLMVILYIRFTEGRVDSQIIEITQTLILSVAGVNAINKFSTSRGSDYDERV
jgi:hypothetical protein